MSKQIPAAERITRAQALIQEARDLPAPAESGRYDLTYMAQVKGLLQEARDLVKFIRYSPSASSELKNEAAKIIQDAEQANREIFR